MTDELTPNDPEAIPAGPEWVRAPVDLSAMLDEQGDVITGPEASATQGPEPSTTLSTGPAPAQSPAAQPGPPLADVLRASVERAQLKRSLGATVAIIRHFILGEVAARDPRLSPERVWALFVSFGAEVPELVKWDPVASTTWRLEMAIATAQRELPGATQAGPALPVPAAPFGRFWQALAATYPELRAALYSPGTASTDVVDRTVRGSHECVAIRAVLQAVREDFEARLVAVFKRDDKTWRDGILTAIDEATARSLAVGVWAGQLGLAKVPPA